MSLAAMSVTRIRAAVIGCVAVATAPGCLTPLAHERFTGRDRVRGIRFSVEEPATVRWAVRGGPRERKGDFSVARAARHCGPLRFFVYAEEGVRALSPGAWIDAALGAGEVAETRLDRAAAPCDLGIFVEHVGRERDPLVALRLGGRAWATTEVTPPRRIGMAFAYPFAALADAIGVTTFVASGAFLFLATSDSPAWYTWTKKHGVERHDVPEDEVLGKSPDRGVYP